jgi:hypothetical protein
MPNGPRKLPKPQTLTVADPDAPPPPPGPAERRRARLTRLAEHAAGPNSGMHPPTEEERAAELARTAAQAARARAEARAAEARAVIALFGRNLGGSIRRRNRRNRKTRRRHK